MLSSSCWYDILEPALAAATITPAAELTAAELVAATGVGKPRVLCVVLAAVVAPPISEPRVDAAVVFCVPKVIPPPLEAVPRGFPVIVVEAAVPRVPRVGPAVLVAWVVPREIPTGLVAAAGCPVKLKPAPAVPRVAPKVRPVVPVGAAEAPTGAAAGVPMEAVGILPMANPASPPNCVPVEAGAFGWVEGVAWGTLPGFCPKENPPGVADAGVADDPKENPPWAGVEDWGCPPKEKGGADVPGAAGFCPNENPPPSGVEVLELAGAPCVDGVWVPNVNPLPPEFPPNILAEVLFFDTSSVLSIIITLSSKLF